MWAWLEDEVPVSAGNPVWPKVLPGKTSSVTCASSLVMLSHCRSPAALPRIVYFYGRMKEKPRMLSTNRILKEHFKSKVQLFG